LPHSSLLLNQLTQMKYKDTEVNMKLGLKAMMIYENIQKEGFTADGFTQLILFFYCSLVAYNDIKDDFDEVLSWLDENPTALNEFSEIIAKENKHNTTLAPSVVDEAKKVSSKQKKD